MTTVSLIYAYWPNQPGGITWCDLPWAVRDAGLPKRLSEAGHEVLETVLMTEDEVDPESLSAGMALAGAIGEAVAQARAAGELPVILCGSCGLAAVGAMKGLGGAKAGTGIVWFDAHADLNTPESSQSGLFEGMALAVATGHAWQAIARHGAGMEHPGALERTALFGVREFDPVEECLIAQLGIPVCPDGAGIAQRLEGCRQVYAHLDMDVHDAASVAANGYAAQGGPDAEQVRAVLAGLDRVSCLSVTGLDPAGPDGRRAADVAVAHVVALADAWSGAGAADR